MLYIILLEFINGYNFIQFFFSKKIKHRSQINTANGYHLKNVCTVEKQFFYTTLTTTNT